MKSFPFLCLALLSLCGITAGAQPAPLPATLSEIVPGPLDDIQPGIGLGAALAADGNLAVVGAPNDDIGADNAGVVKVFNVATGQLLHVLPNPEPLSGSRFGQAVAVSGTRILVGATGSTLYGNSTGKVYLFDTASATPQVPVSTFTFSAYTSVTQFLFVLALSGDRAVVASPQLEKTAVYDLSSPQPTVAVHQLNIRGRSVALGGARLAVGSQSSYGSSQVALYDLAGAAPATPLTTLPGSDKFGQAVAVSGDRLAISAGTSVQIYKLSIDPLTQAMQTSLKHTLPGAPNENFGRTLALSGHRLLVGTRALQAAPANFLVAPTIPAGVTDESGRACLYDLEGATPETPIATLKKNPAETNDASGFAVALTPTHALVGVPGDNILVTQAATRAARSSRAATRSSSVTWSQPSMISDPTMIAGDSIQISRPADATSTIFTTPLIVPLEVIPLEVGSPIFTSSDTLSAASITLSAASITLSAASSTVSTVTVPSASYLGGTLQMSGATIYYGATMQVSGGSVQIGHPSYPGYPSPIGTTTPTPQIQTYLDEKPLQPGTGGVLVYELSTTDFTTPTTTLVHASPEGLNALGAATAAFGQRVVVGTTTGRAFVYDLSAAPVADSVLELQRPSPSDKDGFGLAVAIHGRYVVVGAPNAQTGDYPQSGRVYLYDLDGVQPGQPIEILDNPSPAINFNYGAAVAVFSGEEGGSPYLRFLVGTPRSHGAANRAGVVYAYDRRAGVTTQTMLSPSPSMESGEFGAAVSIFENTILIGAPLADFGAVGDPNRKFAVGAVFAYQVTSTSYSPTQRYFSPTPIRNGKFGAAVACGETHLVIGAPGEDYGNAYVVQGSSLSRLPNLSPGLVPTSLQFGASVAISGHRVAIGAPSTASGGGASEAYVYDLQGYPSSYAGARLVGGAKTNQFGSSVALTSDTAIVGEKLSSLAAPKNGALHLFRPGTHRAPVVTLLGSPTPTIEAHPTTYLDAGATAVDELGLSQTPLRLRFYDFVSHDIGEQTVTWMLDGAEGNIGLATRFVTVVDTTPPVLTLPGDLVFEATRPDGTTALYPEVKVNDNGVIRTFTLSHHSRDLFPIGVTTVIATAVDKAGHQTTGSFTVTVRDTTPPVFYGLPSLLPVEREGRHGAIVHYGQANTWDSVGVASVTYSHASGSVFPVGDTTVLVTATDTLGNVRTESFHVIVLPGSLDKTAPTVKILTPASRNIGATFSVSGTVADDTTLSNLNVKVNGVWVPLAAPIEFVPKTPVAWSVSDLIAENGSNEVVVTATDWAGHTRQITKIFLYENQRTELAGTYQAFLVPNAWAGHHLSGMLTVTVSATGATTGRLAIAGRNFGFTGFLSNAGTSLFDQQPYLILKDLPAAGIYRYLHFSISPTGLNAYVSADHLMTALVAEGTGQVSLYDKTHPVPAALLDAPGKMPATKGTYLLAVPLTSSGSISTPHPSGSGVVSLSLTKRGDVTAKGFLADGTKFTAASKLRSDSSAPLFAHLYETGSLGGELSFADLPDSDVAGSNWLWNRPANDRAKAYPLGWQLLRADPVGTKYTKPGALDFGQGPVNLSAGNASLQLVDGVLGPVTEKFLNVDPTTGAVRKVPAHDPSYALSLDPGTGLFKGFLPHPNALKVNFRGLLLQKGAHRGGDGYFVYPPTTPGGATRSGSVSLQPKQ